jgi:hypothetical protein
MRPCYNPSSNPTSNPRANPRANSQASVDASRASVDTPSGSVDPPIGTLSHPDPKHLGRGPTYKHPGPKTPGARTHLSGVVILLMTPPHFYDYLPFEEDLALYLNKLEFPSPKDNVYQV